MALAFQTRPDREKPSRLFVHGVEKIGKTSFAAFAPKPVFLMSKGEDGLEVLISKGQLPEMPYLPVCQTWEDLLEHCSALARERHDRKTVVLDVCRGFERMLEESVIHDRFRGNADAFHEYARGRKLSVPAWKDFLNGPLDALCRAGMSVVILSHSKTKPIKTPMGEDLLNYYPDSEECYWDETKKWVDQILHLTRLGLVDRDALAKAKRFGDSAKYKNVEAAEARVVCTDQSIFYVAGGRLGLPDQIAMPTVNRPRYPWEGAEAGWQALQGAMRTARTACLKAAGEWAAANAPKPAEAKPAEQPAAPPPPPAAPAAEQPAQHPQPAPAQPPASPPPQASAPPPPPPVAVADQPAEERVTLKYVQDAIFPAMHELGLSWQEVRDKHGAACGIPAAGTLPVVNLTAAQARRVCEVLTAAISTKREKAAKRESNAARKRIAEEEAAADAPVPEEAAA